MVSKKHHFLPVFYLSGFTSSGSKDDQLVVYDILTHKTFRAKPKDVGCENHLYSVHVNGLPTDFIEKNLERDEYVDIIKGIVNNQALPNKEDLKHVAVFVALTIARNPSIRDMLWDIFMGKKGSKYGVTDEKLLYPIFIRDMTRIFYAQLMKGNWTFVFPKDNTATFMCSDLPVDWMPNEEVNHRLHNTFLELSMPLSKNIGIYWRREGGQATTLHTEYADSEMMGNFNFRTLRSANRQIYFSLNFSSDSFKRLCARIVLD